jgi:hypothetical protein
MRPLLPDFSGRLPAVPNLSRLSSQLTGVSRLGAASASCAAVAVAAIESGHCGELQPFGDRDQGGVDEVQPQAGVLLDEFGAPLPVRLGQVDGGELAAGDQAEERGLGGGAEPVQDQPGRFGDHRDRCGQFVPVVAEQAGALVVPVRAPVGSR